MLNITMSGFNYDYIEQAHINFSVMMPLTLDLSAVKSTVMSMNFAWMASHKVGSCNAFEMGGPLPSRNLYL